MRLLRLSTVVLVLLLLAPLAAPLVRADEEGVPEGLTPKEAKSLTGKLRKRAAEWWRRRKRMVMVCPQCRGAGKVRWKGGRRGPMVACPKCEARKIWIDKDPYRHCFYDMRSPAFRLQEGIQERLTKEFVAARAGRPKFPVLIKRYSIKAVQLVDATHGMVHVERNKESVARPQRWIWTKEAGKSPTWYFWDEQADGPWPAPGARPPTPRPAPDPTPPVTPVRPVNPVAPEPRTEPPPPPTLPPATGDRMTVEESKDLVATWTQQRNELTNKLGRLRRGLQSIAGHERTVSNARIFLEEVETWLAEAKLSYERAKEDVEAKQRGALANDRHRVDTLLFKADERLDLVEMMLDSVTPAGGTDAPLPAGETGARWTVADSKKLVAKWEEERNHLTARVIRMRLGIEKVEGYEEKVTNAKKLLDEVDAWLEETKPVYERAKQDVEVKGRGMMLNDRLFVNKRHTLCHRHLEVVEKDLRFIIPDFDD